MKIMGELYKLDFPNGKSYIGISVKGAAHRFLAHKGRAKSSCKASTPLYNAWRKHGAPTMTVLAVLEDGELASAEQRAIAAYDTMFPAGYNLTVGGEVSPMTLPEVRAKVSAALIGREISASTRAALSLAHKGNKHTLGMKVHSEEHKAMMSEKMKGNSFAKGQVVSEERRKATSERSKGNTHNVGKKWSEETKEKMRLAQVARRQRELEMKGQ